MADVQKKSRIFEISIMNVFMCMLVVFIHVSSVSLAVMDKSSWQYLALVVPWRLAAFAVYGFIFISGFKLLLNKPAKFSYWQFLLKRLRLIVLPYVFWVIVYYLYFLNRGYFAFNLPDLLHYLCVGDLSAHFYFVVVIVQFYLLAPLWIWIVKRLNGIFLIAFSLIFTLIMSQSFADILFFFGVDFIYSDRIFTSYLFYWIAGCLAGLHYEKFKDILRKNSMAITVLFAVSAVANAFLGYLNFSGKGHFPRLEDVHIMYCMSAILFFFLMALRFTGKKESKIKAAAVKFVTATDKISYDIYLSHCLVMLIIDELLVKYDGLSLSAGFFIRAAGVYIITICTFLIWRSFIPFNWRKK